MKEKKGRMRWRWALALLAGTFAAGTATAQVNTAVVEVQITDAQSAPLPGTTVTLTATETGAQRLAVADAGGVVRFAALPPGSYRVRFELSGFTPITEENLVLRVGQTAKLQVTLQEARQEEIVVTATAPLVDVFKTDSSTTIVPEQIAYLPVPDRDFQKLAFTAPGVSRERGTFRYIESTPVLGAGGNASQATIMVDGVDFTDPSLGLARARFSQDAIREFRVITNRFDTEIGQSAGGALSIVTRSGGNDLAGTAFGFYRADELREPGALEQDNLPFKRTQFGFTLGGRSPATASTISSPPSRSTRTTSPSSGPRGLSPPRPQMSTTPSIRRWGLPPSTTPLARRSALPAGWCGSATRRRISALALMAGFARQKTA